MCVRAHTLTYVWIYVYALSLSPPLSLLPRSLSPKQKYTPMTDPTILDLDEVELREARMVDGEPILCEEVNKPAVLAGGGCIQDHRRQVPIGPSLEKRRAKSAKAAGSSPGESEDCIPKECSLSNYVVPTHKFVVLDSLFLVNPG